MSLGPFNKKFQDLHLNTPIKFIKPECTSMSSPMGSLPDEILIKIINYVRSFNNLGKNDYVFNQRWERLIKVTAFGQTPRYVYANREPILDHFQALGSVNQRFYRICRPLLWKHLELPNRLPTPMTRWTSELLPKHGTLIESINMELSDDWFEPLIYEDSLTNITKVDLNGLETYLPTNIRDNLILSTYEEDFVRLHPAVDPPQHISPENAKLVISQCPNLRSISLSLPANLNKFEEDYLSDISYEPNEPEGPFRLRHYHLCDLLSSLKSSALQNLQLDFRFHSTISDEGLIQIMNKLPISLKSLSWSGGPSTSVPSNKIGSNIFTKSLTNLLELESLSLRQINCLDSSWIECKPIRSLNKLQIYRCENFQVSLVPRAISTLAPNLTQLIIKFGSLWGDDDDDDEFVNKNQFVYDRLNPNHQFDLPSLLDLTIDHFKGCDLSLSFQTCQNLRAISYENLSTQIWISFIKLICNSTWPQLDYLYLPYPTSDDDDDEGTDESTSTRSERLFYKRQLKSFCLKSNIKLVHKKLTVSSLFQT
ncbi:hypothetical protein CROQUDRAFT_130553 [Cronartium quercuum f. sp. fusiforme G11]|uniref:F-box domain-containing protein n=1 Tax=Cronartium quercuum f. sp. fusiforme G11 TaxID=708437 RepID=A0A9P6NUJ6_9BASI|nr:hypothetical protein CROQUDRAFT_130553 [Cronartium quercuum f. sp. fusiforme G11]